MPAALRIGDRESRYSYVNPQLGVIVLGLSVGEIGSQIEQNRLAAFRTKVRQARVDPAQQLPAAWHLEQTELDEFSS